MNHSADRISLAPCLLEKPVALFTIRKFYFRPCGVGDQLIEEMASKLIFLWLHQPFEIPDPGKGFAFTCFPGSINWEP